MAELLGFRWPHGARQPFSFDLGGTLRGAPFDNESFVAEVKAYKKELDLAEHFRDFLAKCYVALSEQPARCDHFLWISWSPFQAKRWDQHTTAANVERSVLHTANRARVLGVDDEGGAKARLSAEALTRVADRVWLITLSEGQERLVLSPDHYLEVVKLITAERGGGA
jgi:hypothetical protein